MQLLSLPRLEIQSYNEEEGINCRNKGQIVLNQPALSSEPETLHLLLLLAKQITGALLNWSPGVTAEAGSLKWDEPVLPKWCLFSLAFDWQKIVLTEGRSEKNTIKANKWEPLPKLKWTGMLRSCLMEANRAYCFELEEMGDVFGI